MLPLAFRAPLMRAVHGVRATGTRHRSRGRAVGWLKMVIRTFVAFGTLGSEIMRRLSLNLRTSTAAVVAGLVILMEPPTNRSQGASLALGLPSKVIMGNGPRTFQSRTTSARHALLAVETAPDPCLLTCTVQLARGTVSTTAVAEHRSGPTVGK